MKTTSFPFKRPFTSATASPRDHASIKTAFITGSKKGNPMAVAADDAIKVNWLILTLSVKRYPKFITFLIPTIFSTTSVRLSLSLLFPLIMYSIS